MPFKRKPVVTVGKKDWQVRVPNPPKHAIQGVHGWFQYIRMDKKKKILDEYEGTWYWDGNEVEGIDLLEQNM